MKPQRLLHAVPDASPQRVTTVTQVEAKVCFFKQKPGKRFGKAQVPGIEEGLYFRYADMMKLDGEAIRAFEDNEERRLPCPNDVIVVKLHTFTDEDSVSFHTVAQWALREPAHPAKRTRARLRVVESAHV